MEPNFVLMTLPGEQRPEFIEILPFTPANRNNLIGWIAGRSDGEQYGKAIVYDFPKTKLVDGPLQIEARIDQNAQLSGQLSLWNQQGSHVIARQPDRHADRPRRCSTPSRSICRPSAARCRSCASSCSRCRTGWPTDRRSKPVRGPGVVIPGADVADGDQVRGIEGAAQLSDMDRLAVQVWSKLVLMDWHRLAWRERRSAGDVAL